LPSGRDCLESGAIIAGALRREREYDFSKAVRGRFFRPGAVLVPPLSRKDDPVAKR